eukprot:Nitzschia sp. Nitz4//scaffold75_size92586//77259//77741//NITZ4_004869-RA/size92586-exonerate_est2genome-gene-0.62-mRNA-1//1//CDS//3329557747//2799//frame0
MRVPSLNRQTSTAQEYNQLRTPSEECSNELDRQLQRLTVSSNEIPLKSTQQENLTNCNERMDWRASSRRRLVAVEDTQCPDSRQTRTSTRQQGVAVGAEERTVLPPFETIAAAWIRLGRVSSSTDGESLAVATH